MSLQVIPLTNSPNQKFTVQVAIDGTVVTLNVALNYNTMVGYWTMSISDYANKLLVASVPFVTGTYPAGNMLEQQRYLGIGSWYMVNVSNLSSDDGADVGYGQGYYGFGPYGGQSGSAGLDWPDDTNLGTDFQLWVDDTPSV